MHEFIPLLISFVIFLIWLGIALRATAALEKQAKLKELELLGGFLEKHVGIEDVEVERCLRETPLARDFGGGDFLEALYNWKLHKLQKRFFSPIQKDSLPKELRPTYEIFSKMTGDELLDIVNRPANYTPEAVELAHRILSEREER